MHARTLYGPALVQPLIAAVRRRPDRPAIRRFFAEAVCGSSDESLAWLHLLRARPSEPNRCPPMRVGYRQSAVLDANNQVVGDRPAPCILIREPFPCIFFPQVRVRLAQIPKDYPYAHAELDFLVVAKLNRRRLRVANVEVDGFGHDSRLDEPRRKALQLPRIAILPKHLRDPAMLENLMEDIRGC